MIQFNTKNTVTLEVIKKDEIPKFKKDLQEAFTRAVIEEFGELNGLIPPDKDIEQSINAPGAITYHILLDGKNVGGAIVTIDEIDQHNSLDFFFISLSEHSRGIGLKAWKAIEEKYPKTKVWETCTPYFEKRNIHFYVNKCGFKIVEYFNKNHHDSHIPDDKGLPEDEDFFRFEKVMK